MNRQYTLHTSTALADGLRHLFQQLEDRLSLSSPLTAYLAGGMAIHLYTANRVTADVDAEFSGKFFMPSDIMAQVTLEDGSSQLVYFDTNYNSTFALMHEDYQQDVMDVDLGLSMVHVKVLSPVDLAVSKIARLADNDKEDIVALVQLGLTSSEEIEQRATEALVNYVGNLQMLRLNIQDAVDLAKAAEDKARQEKKAMEKWIPK
jgi:hypothetical protein